MSKTLDPKIAAKLEAFARRRRQLILLRGLASGLAMLFATMMLVALIDWLFVLSDPMRWILSGLAYLAVVVTEWRSCLRLLTHAPGPRRLARLVEHAEPKLREDLLSAVELGSFDEKEVLDSPQFRALLQSDVATRMERLDVKELLPVRLLSRPLMIAAAIAVVVVAGFLLSGAQLGTLLMRAMLPMANLARVSRVKVEIVQPNPADRIVAQGDAETLIVQLGGQRANKAFLETFTTAGHRELIAMAPIGHDRFTAAIQVARENVQYRVRAGDAITRKYQLTSVARPVVASFQKLYTGPAYARVEPRQVVEENGDLIALEGSVVDVSIETNQPIKSGELRVEQGKKSYTVQLAEKDGRLSGRISLDASGVYRVHLVSAQSGFENRFSPEYELRAEPDLVPEIELTTPLHDLILPASESVEIAGTARDDQALARVAQLFRINEGAWKQFDLASEPGKESKVTRRWDLFSEGVKAGDFVTTKLLAVDRKGNRAESKPVQFTIIQSGFESRRLQTLERMRRLGAMVEELRPAAEAFEKAQHEARAQFEKLPDGDGGRRQVVMGVTSKLEELRQKVAEVWTQLMSDARAAEPGHESAELAMMARIFSKLDAGVLQPSRIEFETVGNSLDGPNAREQMREATQGLFRIGHHTRLAAENWRRVLAAEEADVVLENLSVVKTEHERVVDLAGDAGDDAARWVPLANRMRVVVSELKTLDELIQPIEERRNLPADADGRMKRMRKRLQESSAAARTIAKPEATTVELRAAMVELGRVISDSVRSIADLRRDLGNVTANGVNRVFQELGPAFVNFDKLRDESLRISSRKNFSDAVRGSLIRGEWDARIGTLKRDGDAEEARVSGDALYVGDVRATTLALESMQPGTTREELQPQLPRLTALDRAFRILEAGHLVAETLEGLRLLSAAEKWEIVTPRARTVNAHDWEWFAARMRTLPAELSRTNLEGEPRKVMEAAQRLLTEARQLQAFESVEREMRERSRPERQPERVAVEVDLVAVLVKQALNLLRAPMDEARKQIAAMAPKLPEMMQQLAKEADRMKEETAQKAEKVEASKPEETQEQSRQQLASQEKLNARVETLRDAIRAEANKQDFLSTEGREAARDADDALAMLKEPPKNAADALAEAARSDAPQEQKQALRDAAAQQQKLADNLKQLAQHFENADKGNPQQTRAALRATEVENGVKQELDQQYAKAEDMEKMAKQSPEDLLRQLEQALPKNPLMQQELSAIARNTLTEAQQKLEKASGTEQAVAQAVNKMAADQAAQAANGSPQTPTPAAQPQPGGQQPAAPSARGQQPTAQNQPPVPPANPQLGAEAKKQPMVAGAAVEAGADVERAGRHEERMKNVQTGHQLQQLGKQIGDTGTNEIPKAAEALQNSQTAAQAQAPVNAAAEALKKNLGALESAANGQPMAPLPAPGQVPDGTPPNAGQSPQTPGTPDAPNASAANKPSAPAQSAVQPQAPGAPAQPGQPGTNAGPNQPTAPANGAPQTPRDFLKQLAEMTPPTPQEQMWMARALDALDQALNGRPPQNGAAGQQAQAGQQPGQQPGEQPGQGQPQNQQPGQPGQKAAAASQAMAQAQAAMAAAAQAAANAQRNARNQDAAEQPPGETSEADMQSASKTGAQVDAANKAYGAMPDAKGLKAGEWGKLPKKVAEQMNQGQRETVAGEYRQQVETYYRVIAEKAKKP